MSDSSLKNALLACIAEAELAGAAHTLPLIDVHCQKIRTIAKRALDELNDQRASDRQDAERCRKLCALLQTAYESNAVESEKLTVYCSMLSGWRDLQTVKGELVWHDKRDGTALDLAAALDAIDIAL